jgi:hypothetical protein
VFDEVVRDELVHHGEVAGSEQSGASLTIDDVAQLGPAAVIPVAHVAPAGVRRRDRAAPRAGTLDRSTSRVAGAG